MQQMDEYWPYSWGRLSPNNYGCYFCRDTGSRAVAAFQWERTFHFHLTLNKSLFKDLVLNLSTHISVSDTSAITGPGNIQNSIHNARQGS